MIVVESTMYTYAVSILAYATAPSIPLIGLSKFFEENTGTIAVIGLIITIIFFIAERINERLARNNEYNEKKSRACNAILKEIEDHRDTFRNPNNQKDYVIREGGIRYSPRIFSHIPSKAYYTQDCLQISEVRPRIP